MKQSLKKYIIEKGKSICESNYSIDKKSINENTLICINWVNKIINLKKYIYNIVLNCFNNDRIFDVIINASFQNFINGFDRATEYLAVYLDYYIKNTQEVNIN